MEKGKAVGRGGHFNGDNILNWAEKCPYRPMKLPS